ASPSTCSPARSRGATRSTGPLSDLSAFDPPPFDPTAPLTATGNLRRRQLVSRAVVWCATTAAAAAVAVLGIVTYTVIHRGAGSLSLGFLIHDPPQYGGAGARGRQR